MRLLTLIFSLAFCVCSGADEKPYIELRIQGQPAPKGYAGIYDPSLAFGPKAGWMAYSMVVNPGVVETHIARTDDQGQTWRHVMRVNAATPGSVVHEGATIKGIWRHEVPCLVYDPTDTGREWKLYWHKYFARPPYYGKGVRMFQYGWIAMRSAASPKGPWSPERALFKGLVPFESAKYPVAQSLNGLHPELRRVVTYTEPGARVIGGVLYLSLSAATGKHRTDRTILLSSRDHGKRWKYHGALTTHADAVSLGHKHLTASSLVEAGGKVYLLSTPVTLNAKLEAAVYRGLYVFEIESLARAKLRRNAAGKLRVVRYLGPKLDRAFHSGVSDYDPGNKHGGILFGQVRFEGQPARPFFRIYKTQRAIR